MPDVLVPLPPGFEEIEAVTIVDILRRAGVNVIVAGTIAGPVTGGHGIAVVPEKTLDEVAGRRFDLVVLPGGGEGTAHLRRDPRVATLLREHAAHGGYLAAICAAPTVLSDLGFLTATTRVTSHPSCQSEFTASDYRTDRVVTDGRIITSRSPGTALEFALDLVSLLMGADEGRRIGRQVLAHGADHAV